MVSVKMFKKTTGWTHTKNYKSTENNTGRKGKRGPAKGNQNEHQSMTQIGATLRGVNLDWHELMRGRVFEDYPKLSTVNI